LQKEKQKEFLTLKQENLSVMEYANRFAERSRFVPEYVATDYMRMQRFEEGLAPYIRNHLAGQPVQSSQELYERAADVERVKNELRMAHSVNPKKRWNEKANPAEGSLSKKPAVMKSKCQGSTPSRKHCTKCGRTNHDTSKYRVGTNCCFWCRDPRHLIANCPARTAQQNKDPAPLKISKAPIPTTSHQVGRAYVINKKQADGAITVVTVRILLTPYPSLFYLIRGPPILLFHRMPPLKYGEKKMLAR